MAVPVRTRLVAAVVFATTIGVGVAVVLASRGSGGSSAFANFKPPVPAVQILKVLKVARLHPTSCVQHGSQVICALANGGRCKVTVGGSGSCTGDGVDAARIVMTTGTATATQLP